MRLFAKLIREGPGTFSLMKSKNQTQERRKQQASQDMITWAQSPFQLAKYASKVILACASRRVSYHFKMESLFLIGWT